MITAASSSLPRADASLQQEPAPRRFNSILAATDCTPASATAVKLAARLAKQFHAKLYLFHSILPELYAVDLRGPVPELALADLRAARENLHAYAQRIAELRTTKHEEIVFLGSVTEAIQAAADAHRIDLLVLGSHGRQGLAKLALGSVAEWAIHRLSFPVLVAGPACGKDQKPINSIVVALNLAYDVEPLVRYAVSVARTYNACLTLCHVLTGAHTPEEQAKGELRVVKELHRLVPAAGHDDFTLNFEVLSGEIASAVLQSALQNKADLIVLGARHKPPLVDHVPRTKLSAIIRASHCPVLVVPSSSTPYPAHLSTTLI